MIVGRNADRLAAAVEEIDAVKDNGGAIRYEPTDVTNEDEATNAVEAVTAWHGRLHGVVHCAAMLAHAVNDKKFLWASNVDGTRNVMEAMRLHGVPQMKIIAPSAAV